MPPGTKEQWNVSRIGYHDLDGRPGLKMAMQEVGGRWYLYMGHFWHPGWSIVDVTDPTSPELKTFVESSSNAWCHQIQVADGLMVTGLDYPRPGWQPVDGPGYDLDGDVTEGAYVWDVTDPVDPERLGHYRTGGQGTHRNHFDGGDHVYLAASPDGYEGYLLTIVDISDPERPERTARWWWEGQAPEEDSPPDAGFFDVPGWEAYFTRPAPALGYFHGPAYVEDERAYLSYGRLGMVILDVSDKTDPQLVSQFDFGGLGGRLGTHSVVPIPDTDLVVANSEAIEERDGDSLNYAFVVDVSNEEHPIVESQLPLPTPEDDLPYKNYYEKGGRFGPHNQHHYQGLDCLWRPTDLLFVAWFNAGLRIFDVSDPLVPREVGYYVPEDPVKRRGTRPHSLVTQFEDVIVDARGYIYCTDKNHGLFVLEHDIDFVGYDGAR